MLPDHPDESSGIGSNPGETERSSARPSPLCSVVSDEASGSDASPCEPCMLWSPPRDHTPTAFFGRFPRTHPKVHDTDLCSQGILNGTSQVSYVPLCIVAYRENIQSVYAEPKCVTDAMRPQKSTRFGNEARGI